MTDRLLSADSLELHYHCRAAGSAVATIVLVHGVGEHRGRYEHTTSFLHEHGYTCWTYDQRGFGESAGVRGHVAGFDRYADDLDKIVDLARDRDPERPLFVLGHSMGSVVALIYAIRRPAPLDGLLSLSTPLVTPQLTLRLAMPVAGLLSRITPALSIPNQFEPDWLSHDAQVVSDYQQDPLNVHSVTTSWIRSFLDARTQVLETANRIAVPVFIAHGTADRIADFAGAQHLAERLDPDLATVRKFDGLRHELLNEAEPGRSDVRREIVSWLERIRKNLDQTQALGSTEPAARGQ